VNYAGKSDGGGGLQEDGEALRMSAELFYILLFFVKLCFRTEYLFLSNLKPLNVDTFVAVFPKPKTYLRFLTLHCSLTRRSLVY
jgi:hypothetical protein